jgi:uncharacterized ferritin-like protein (DUF455 family)
LTAALADAARQVLATADPAEKVRLTREAAEAWAVGRIVEIGAQGAPDRPARPTRPELRRPADMPRRKKRSLDGRRAFLHAIAHIELNAVDLAWDIVARFANPTLPRRFYDDFVDTARDEADHFAMLDRRLRELGAAYGDLPAHDGLWEAAAATADDLAARLALVPMVLEARGLDTTPKAVAELEAAGDPESAAMLAKIGREEIPHVAAGVRWFAHLCRAAGHDPEARFHAIVRERFKGSLKPPFNDDARAQAGMLPGYYRPLVA